MHVPGLSGLRSVGTRHRNTHDGHSRTRDTSTQNEILRPWIVMHPYAVASRTYVLSAAEKEEQTTISLVTQICAVS
jgi:hypothetical protein